MQNCYLCTFFPSTQYIHEKICLLQFAFFPFIFENLYKYSLTLPVPPLFSKYLRKEFFSPFSSLFVPKMETRIKLPLHRLRRFFLHRLSIQRNVSLSNVAIIILLMFHKIISGSELIVQRSAACKYVGII